MVMTGLNFNIQDFHGYPQSPIRLQRSCELVESPALATPTSEAYPDKHCSLKDHGLGGPLPKRRDNCAGTS